MNFKIVGNGHHLNNLTALKWKYVQKEKSLEYIIYYQLGGTNIKWFYKDWTSYHSSQERQRTYKMVEIFEKFVEKPLVIFCGVLQNYL